MNRAQLRPVGMIPAAGTAARLPRLPCSKEVLPLGYFTQADGRLSARVPVCHLLDAFRNAGVDQAIVGLRVGKWDIPSYLANGDDFGVNLAYVPLRASNSVVDTIRALLPFVDERLVAFGFPDIVFYPQNAISRLMEEQRRTDDELVLGLFPTRSPEKSDMVEVNRFDRVENIEIKPVRSDLRMMWALAVWTPKFSARIAAIAETIDASAGEAHLGHVFKQALELGIQVTAVRFVDTFLLDVGTPDDLLSVSRDGREDPG